MNLEIIYDPSTGISYPDGHLESVAKNMVTNRGKYVIGSELLFQYIRVAVLRGDIAPEDVIIRFGDCTIPIGKNGKLFCWPKGFCDHYDNTLNDLLDYHPET